MSLQKMLDEAIAVAKSNKDLSFQPVLHWDLPTIKGVYKYAKAVGISNNDWLPAVNLWLRLDYVLNTISQEAALRLMQSQIDELVDLANFLDIKNKKWIIVLVEKPGEVIV
jgi:hypothetical protein